MRFSLRPFFLGMFGVWLFFPFISIILWSFATGWRFPAVFPDGYSLRGYRIALDPSGDILRGVVTSTIIALIVGLIATAIGSAAGRAIALYNFMWKKAFQFLVLAPLIVPGIVSANPYLIKTT